jgi:hypothetical protein
MGYIQNANGGVGYDAPNSLVNESKTGGLLVQTAFTGYAGSVSGPGDNSDKAGAIAFLDARWDSTANSTWDGNFGHPYAMWSIYKGLESTIGLTGSQISNFFYDPAARVKDDPADVWNWWEDYSQYLVQTQNPDGSWGGYSYWTGAMAAAWNINILNATEIPNGNDVPEPATLALLAAGLAGLASLRRRPAC